MIAKKICIVTTGIAYGGAETQLVSLAIALKRRGWDVTIVSMLPPTAFVSQIENERIPIFNLNMKRGRPKISALLGLARLYKKLKPDVVHSHMVHANLLARTARALQSVPALVCTAHSINEGGRLREFAYRMTDWLCDMTTQVSRVGMERYIEVKAAPSRKITFIPNGVNLSRFKPRESDEDHANPERHQSDDFIWIAVGRFDEPKDYPSLISSISKISGEKFSLLIVGDGILRFQIQEQVSKLNLNSKVKFLGIRDDIPALMNSADGYVMSSKWEGMPNVLLEAAATGLPIVATRVGGIPEVVLDNETGFLVPAGDSDLLAMAMKKMMLLSHKDRLTMGARSRDFVTKNFGLESILNRWEQLYFDLMEQKGG